ncbi:MAG: DNA internalization-related competence protein ComEC/Rec2 [candidate division KSB1 bacterium]|nr:DNA internalization-related competence protein ComEC/Rec2 [candidate division KSB1 bacterium]
MASRPAFFIAIVFGLGIWAQRALHLPWVVLAIGFGLLFIAASLNFRRPRIYRQKNLSSNFFMDEQSNTKPQQKIMGLDFLLLAACFAAGMMRTHIAEKPAPNEVSVFADPTTKILLIGQAQNVPEHHGERWRLPLAAESIRLLDGRWVEASGLVLVSGEQLGDIEVGETLLLYGNLRLADASRNPGAFDYRAYLQAHGISAVFSCGDQAPLWREKPSGRLSWRRAISQIKKWIEARLAYFSQGQNLALLRGLLIGERDEISKEVIEAFAQTGLIHILAVSGLHVGFVVLIFFLTLELLRVPRRWRLPFILAGLLFYVYLTGAKPPVVRASLMAAVILIGGSLERDTNIYNSLGVAALVILFWQPLQLFQLGFQLSFAAVLGIAYLYRPLLFLLTRVIRLRWRPLRWAVALMAVSFAAQLATLPFTVQAFGRLPLTSIWGNLLIIPGAFVSVASAAAACVFSFSTFVSQAFGNVADLVAATMIAFTHWLATIPFAYVDQIYVSVWLLIFYVIGVIILVEWRKAALRNRLLMAGLLVLNMFIWQQAWSAGPRLRVTFFDVGQGDAALLEFPNKRLLIDTGPLEENTDAAARVLVPFFQRRGIRQLEAVIISHPHADHLGGLPTLLRELQIKKIFLSNAESDSPLEQNCEKLLDSLQVPRLVLTTGQRLLDFAPAEVWVMHPHRDRPQAHNVNEASVVVKVIFGKYAFLFPGDVESESENCLLEFAGVLDSDVLKVSHHGSETSSLAPFLNAVSPQWAVASAGRWNRFGHPHPTVIARYDSLGIALLRTDQHGAIIFETDGKTLKRTR